MRRESTEEDGYEKTNDFVNPITEVVKEWVNKRQNYINEHRTHHRGPRAEEILDASDIEDGNKKPRLEEFLNEFENQIKHVNQIYRKTKSQFESDMKTFKDEDIQMEEEMLEK